MAVRRDRAGQREGIGPSETPATRVILASAIVAAFHADLITMCVVWIPLYLMYEVSIWVARIFARKRGAVVAAVPA
jgi:Sec-independent protein secretion pathway component TatC